jgi:hypothetical protein
VQLDFDQSQWAVTPGQSAVLYDAEVCLGGGVITAAQTPVFKPSMAGRSAAGRRRLRASAAQTMRLPG